ncbi:MAG: RibD family protein, partial [Bacteroidota bacterium]|nr:RibD family protein [Bacteroidota bacterium]
EKECRFLNRRFFTFHTQKRPYIILKWAQTQDGFIAREDLTSKWISNACSRLLVHHWRGQEDAVLTGPRTALIDNPKLTVREMAGKNPVRIAIDREGKLPGTHSLFDGESDTIIFTAGKPRKINRTEWITIDFSGQFIQQILGVLYERNIQSVIIEGGSTWLNFHINEDLWDEARVFTGGVTFGKGINAPAIYGSRSESFSVKNDKLNIHYR